MQRILLLASGSGSNAERVIEHFADSSEARVVAVVSDRREAGVHERARRRGVAAEWLSPKQRATPGGVLRVLRKHEPDVVVLAGYLKLVPRDVVAHFAGRLINIHPALLPNYGGAGMYGRHVHEAVAKNGDRVSGITIHLADEAYDRGRVLFQATVPIALGSSADEIAAAVLALEHRHFASVIGAHLRYLAAGAPIS